MGHEELLLLLLLFVEPLAKVAIDESSWDEHGSAHGGEVERKQR